MSPIACGCNKRNRVTASGAPAPSGTYRVYVEGRKVYETGNQSAADTVAARFVNAQVFEPGVEAK